MNAASGTLPPAPDQGPALRGRLAAGVFWTIAGRLLVSASGFGATLVLARLLPTADLGRYFLVVSALTVAAISAQLGLQVVVVRLVAEGLAAGRPGEAHAVVRAALRIAAACAATLGVAVALAGLLAGGEAGRLPSPAGIALAAGWMALLAVLGVAAEAFRGLHDYRRASLLGAGVYGVAFLAATAPALAIAGRVSLETVIALGVVAAAASLTATVVVLARRLSALGPPARVRALDLVRTGLPLMVATLAGFAAAQADLWVVGALRSPEEVAHYGAATRLVLLLMTPMLVMGAVVAPLVAELHARARLAELDRALRAAALVDAAVGLVVLAALGLGGEPLLVAVYGEPFRSAAVPLALLAAGYAAAAMAGSATTVLAMTGRQRALMVITVSIVGLQLAAGVAVVPRFGVAGMAAVSAVATALGAFAAMAWVRRETGLRTYVRTGDLPGLLRSVMFGH
jgi:O-antigen/teichoic acid export membrane protein